MSDKNKKKTKIGAAIKLWIAMEAKGILFVLPFDTPGDIIANQIFYAANIDQPVLIHGPSGTGKELATKAIHLLGNRSKKQLKSINCANLSKETFESELFGHKKGSFTSAFTDKQGLIETVEDGIIHLDEIGELGRDVQAKMLRLFETGEYYRIGENNVRQSRAKFVLTTLQPINQIRNDIIHRMGEKIYLPPIKEYKSRGIYEVFLLHFISVKHYKAFYNKMPDINISYGAITELMFYEWPGNIRELENLVKKNIDKTEKGVNLEQMDFFNRKGIKMPAQKAICTFGLYEYVKEFDYIPIEIYNEYERLLDVISFEPTKLIQETLNRGMKARISPIKQLADKYPETDDKLSLLEKVLHNKHSIASNANPFEFFSKYLEKQNPLDELEHDFLLNFIVKYNTEISMDEAARILSLSGGEKFKRLLKKHNLNFITKNQWKKFYKM